jgi:hypothetical protein
MIVGYVCFSIKRLCLGQSIILPNLIQLEMGRPAGTDVCGLWLFF